MDVARESVKERGVVRKKIYEMHQMGSCESRVTQQAETYRERAEQIIRKN